MRELLRAFTTFPGKIFAASLSWVEAVYPNLRYFNGVESAATSSPGRSHNSSQRRFARCSGRCVNRRT
jgi:hypothetical protein